MQDLIFVHGMFQNPKSWSKWADHFSSKGYNCVAPAWPLHEGEPSALRLNPSPALGTLSLNEVIASIEQVASRYENPLMIGHSVGGLITQILLNRGSIAAGVAVNSVAPNKMLDFDWSFFKNSAIITNPLKGDDPVYMDEETFHGAFANTLSEEDADRAFEEFAIHDSRNVLRDCMGKDGHIDLDKPHGPLLLIAGSEDQIIPADLNEKNAKAYKDEASFKVFPNRSHYICGEPGWEEVAEYVAGWLEQNAAANRLIKDHPQRFARAS